MVPDEIAGLICSRLEQKGYRARVLPIERVAQLKQEIEEGLSQGRIDPGLYEKYLTYFKFDVAASLPGARSIIMTAAPQPQRRATFHFQGKMCSTIVPPTYYHDTDNPIKEILNNILSSNGYQFGAGALPLKLLAVHSGMASYGKNNIAYAEGLGSFMRLRAFLSDMPASRSDWLEPQVMKECGSCTACVKACPTRAIVSDRFFIHGERCLTFFNEDTEEFPEWVGPAWHNSLIGCMRCQLACPANRPFVKWVEEGETFDEAETELLLSGAPLDDIPPETAHKLKRSYMVEYLDVLPRNLRALLK
jgi:epoxyqueuosine reductase